MEHFEMFPQAVRGKIIMVLGCDFQVSGIPEIYNKGTLLRPINSLI
jgi:hypothetical protein